jgi:hypothetical protein
MRTIRILILLPAVFALGVMTGCSDYKVELKSNTSWSGVFGGKTINGSGNLIIDLPDEGRQCITIQKNTVDGWVRARVYDATDTANAWEWQETGEAYGTIDFCADY